MGQREQIWTSSEPSRLATHLSTQRSAHANAEANEHANFEQHTFTLADDQPTFASWAASTPGYNTPSGVTNPLPADTPAQPTSPVLQQFIALGPTVPAPNFQPIQQQPQPVLSQTSAQLQVLADAAQDLQSESQDEHVMSSSEDNDEALSCLKFARGMDVDEYLAEVPIFTRAGATNNNDILGIRLVARAIQGCGRKERKLLVNDAWMEQLTAAPAEGDEWVGFQEAFRKLFATKSMSERIEEFMQMDQNAPLTEWLPEYFLSTKDAWMEVKLNSVDIHQILHLINATTDFSSWIRGLKNSIQHYHL